MTISFNSLLPNDKPQALATGIGSLISPKPVAEKLLGVDVAPIITILSTDFKTLIRVLRFFYLFFDL